MSINRTILFLFCFAKFDFAMADVTEHSEGLHQTKLVKEFQNKEIQLNQILFHQDKLNAAKYFSENFEIIFSEVQSHSSNIDDAFQDFAQNKKRILKINDLSVRDLNGSIVVNFNLNELNNDQHSWFVVDIWSKYNDDFKLDKRFISPLKKINASLPPGFLNQERIKKKY